MSWQNSSRWVLGGRNRSRGFERVLLTGLLTMFYSVYLLIPLKIICPGGDTVQNALGIFTSITNEDNILRDLVISQYDRRIFSMEIPSS